MFSEGDIVPNSGRGKRAMRLLPSQSQQDEAFTVQPPKPHPADDLGAVVFRHSPVAVALSTLSDGRFIDVNDAFLKLFELTHEEVIGRTSVEVGLWHALEERDVLVRQLQDQTPGHVDDMVTRTRSGRELHLLYSANLVHIDGVKMLLSFVFDLTERRLLEGKLAQSQRLDTVGRLAGGIAHDFNNVLSIVTGYNDMMRLALVDSSPLRDYAEGISNAVERAASLTRQLLAFGRRQTLAPEVVDVNALLHDMYRLLKRLIGEDVDLHLDCEAGLYNVRVDPSQLEQVLMNLVVNAREAMPQGGRLDIRTFRCTDASSPVKLAAGEYVMICVEDTGCGMDSQTLQHIFEPFFSTKDVDRGAGLGLATVYGIVQQSGGHVEVHSVPEAGTRFEVFLPGVREKARRADAGGVAAAVPGIGTILVVEDDPVVRNTVALGLRRFGYLVLQASSAEDALRISEEYCEPIDLLLADVIMPNLSGLKLAARMSAHRETHVLFMSGYTDDALDRHGACKNTPNLLLKPFTIEELLDRVRDTLQA